MELRLLLILKFVLLNRLLWSRIVFARLRSFRPRILLGKRVLLRILLKRSWDEVLKSCVLCVALIVILKMLSRVVLVLVLVSTLMLTWLGHGRLRLR